MNQSIIKPKRPTGDGWARVAKWLCPPQLAELGYPVEPLFIQFTTILEALRIAEAVSEKHYGQQL